MSGKFSRYTMCDSRDSGIEAKNGIIDGGSGEKDLGLLVAFGMEAGGGNTIDLPISDIGDYEFQGRSYIEVSSLMQSIEDIGLRYAPSVHYDSELGKYTLRSGHRRVEAAKQLGYTSIRFVCINKSVEAAVEAFATNKEQEKLHPIDVGVDVVGVCEAYRKKTGKLPSNEELASLYKVSESMISVWKGYGLISAEIRRELTHRNIRDSKVLNKISKLCKNAEGEIEDPEEKRKFINNEAKAIIDDWIARKYSKNKVTDKIEVEKMPSNFIYFCQKDSSIKIREKVIKKLDKKGKEELAKMAKKVLEMCNENGGE